MVASLGCKRRGGFSPRSMPTSPASRVSRSERVAWGPKAKEAEVQRPKRCRAKNSARVVARAR
eukprot:8463919-Lingulodinium_polyedra.AAC.1